MKINTVFLFCLLYLSQLSQAQDLAGKHVFYDIPIIDGAKHIEKKDLDYEELATLRYATELSPRKVIAFYQQKITAEMNLRKFKQTTILSYKNNGLSRMISITNYYGVADVVIQVQKPNTN